MPRIKGQRLWKVVDQAVWSTATVVFDTVQYFNKYRPGASFIPKWSDKPLLKSYQKTKPQLGWPRQTDSLCPECVKDARAKIMNGDENWQSLLTEKTGEIKANIIERDGEVWMIKDCPVHGHFEDMMAADAKFLSWIERNFPGRKMSAMIQKPVTIQRDVGIERSQDNAEILVDKWVGINVDNQRRSAQFDSAISVNRWSANLDRSEERRVGKECRS